MLTKVRRIELVQAWARHTLVGSVVLVAGCASDPAPDATGEVGTLTLTATHSGTSDATGGTSGGTDSGDPDTGKTSYDLPKFDVGPPDGGPPIEDGDGCTKVDFLFVIDSSNSMATNQAELVASFPEFVATIVGTLSDVDSYHVGVVTSDAYDFNAAGCTMTGALVTQTGGVNSSNATCDPYASGFRYMTEADDLPAKFGCAALVGTAGDNNERMMDGALEAISPGLHAMGACNEGFVRDDALLVLVFISDEDDPGSSGVGSPGDPSSWFDDVVAVKGFEENVVVLTLTRGSPGNVCGGAQGSEVDGDRLMAFAQLFGPNGFLGDICANSFGPFFEEATDVVANACDNFVGPVG